MLMFTGRLNNWILALWPTVAFSFDVRNGRNCRSATTVYLHTMHQENFACCSSSSSSGSGSGVVVVVAGAEIVVVVVVVAVIVIQFSASFLMRCTETVIIIIINRAAGYCTELYCCKLQSSGHQFEFQPIYGRCAVSSPVALGEQHKA